MSRKLGMSTLRLGSQGESVLRLQKYLSQLGYYHGLIDGNLNIQTYEAIRDFQKRVGLFPRGTVDSATWRAIVNCVSYKDVN